MHLPILTAALALVAGVSSHPETDVERREMMDSIRRLAAHSKRSLEQCGSSAAYVALRERAVARRAAWAADIRAGRGLPSLSRRDVESFKKYEAQSHNLEDKGLNLGGIDLNGPKDLLKPPLDLLFGSNSSCVLVPETIIGPYYVEGEKIRSDVGEGQAGVPTFADLQFIDINTCKPVDGMMVDFWHANATGVYSVVTAPGQGGLKTNHGRGLQKTSPDGVVQFKTVFPGHYEGRTAHFHVLTSENVTMLPNDTFTGGTTTHIGQVYFDQSLITDVEANEPYSTNKQNLTTNAQDEFAQEEATAEYDPFMKYIKLGDNIQDGVMAWITIGIDLKADYTAKRIAAAKLQEGGAVDESQPKPTDSG